MWRKLLVTVPLILVCQSAHAKTFTVDGEQINLLAIINTAEAQGSLSRQQARQIRAEESAICQREQKFKANHNGVISSIEQAKINSQVINLRLRIKKLCNLPGDNSGQNIGDNRPEAITPQVQSLKPSDLRIVTAIRRAMIKDANLSTNAKNAKVIVISGKVILRGPVASSTEKQTIFGLAENCVGAENILNELEVLPK
ncbi:MAG: BON domain-containing protein [Candidatus Obscuribacterales bacterium]